MPFPVNKEEADILLARIATVLIGYLELLIQGQAKVTVNERQQPFSDSFLLIRGWIVIRLGSRRSDSRHCQDVRIDYFRNQNVPRDWSLACFSIAYFIC